MKHTLPSACIAFIVAAASVTGVSQTPAPSAQAAAAPSAALLTQYWVNSAADGAPAAGVLDAGVWLTPVTDAAATKNAMNAESSVCFMSARTRCRR